MSHQACDKKNQKKLLPATGRFARKYLPALQSREARLLYRASGLTERKYLRDIDWSYNPKLPKRECLELGTLKFIDAKKDILLVGQPGTGKSHIAIDFMAQP